MKHLRERLRAIGQAEAKPRHIAIGLAVLIGVVVVVRTLLPDPTAGYVSLEEVLGLVEDGSADLVEFDEAGILTVTVGEEQTVAAVPVRAGDPVLERLLDSQVPLEIIPAAGPGLGVSFLLATAPILLMGAALLVYLRSRGQAGMVAAEQRPQITLDDVIGADEAVDEARELVRFLADPDLYSRYGARPPKGVLLVGPPGVGKTLLAKAVAGEADVPYFQTSGSDFVEMFAGLGARRVRNLFTAARKAAEDGKGAIVFIDEVDAVGRKRGAQTSGAASQEAEQTLNALLVALDGFQARTGVIVLAATNRPDILDPALTRPGRFDRTISFGLPDLHARTRLIAHELNRVPIDTDVDAAMHARRLPGASGADLVNVVDTAGVLAAREGADTLTDTHMQAAWDRLNIGAPRTGAVVHPDDRRATAIHEAGHTVAGLLLPNAPAPTKVTIIPHGSGVGGATVTDGSDRQMLTLAQADSRLVVLMAGRAAEHLVLGDGAVTNGAAGDIQAATSLARAMVTEWGWGTFGTVRLDGLGPDGPLAGDVADDIARMLADALEQASRLLTDQRDLLDAITDALDDHDTLTADQLNELRDRHTADDATPMAS